MRLVIRIHIKSMFNGQVLPGIGLSFVLFYSQTIPVAPGDVEFGAGSAAMLKQ